MTFRKKLAAAAEQLGCEVTQDAVRRACRQRADSICGEIGHDLLPAERLEALANHFSVEFHVADTSQALDAHISRLARQGDTGFALRRQRFEQELLAAILRRREPSASDRRFVALIDARGHKKHMAFFSKTHEVAHPALEPQLQFEFRDETKRRDEWERFVDQVGAANVFAGEPWDLAVRQAAKDGLTIHSFETVRRNVAPEASLTAIALAAANTLGRALFVVWSGLATSRANPKPALRILTVTPSDIAADAKAFLPTNFRVPSTSPLAIAFSTKADASGNESLQEWRDSKGATLGEHGIWTSASPRNDGVLGIIVPAPARRPTRRPR